MIFQITERDMIKAICDVKLVARSQNADGRFGENNRSTCNR